MGFYGYKTTKQGRALIAKLLATETLKITRVMAGEGRCESLEDADLLTDLIDPRMQGTSTVPVYNKDIVTMSMEFRPDLNGGLTKGFFLYEVGVYAMDPDEGEILMYYGSLDDKYVFLSAYNENKNTIARFNVSITVGEDCGGVTTGYPPEAFVTHEDLLEWSGNHHVGSTMDFTAKEGTVWIRTTPDVSPPETPEPEPEPEPEPVPPEDTGDLLKGGDAYDLRLVDDMCELNVSIDGEEKGVPFVEKVNDSIYKLT